MDHMDLVGWVAPGVEAHWLNQAAQKGDSRAQYQIARSAGEEGIHSESGTTGQYHLAREKTWLFWTFMYNDLLTDSLLVE